MKKVILDKVVFKYLSPPNFKHKFIVELQGTILMPKLQS